MNNLELSNQKSQRRSHCASLQGQARSLQAAYGQSCNRSVPRRHSARGRVGRPPGKRWITAVKSTLLRELLAARRTAATPDLAAALQACGLPIATVWGVSFVEIDGHHYAPVAGGKPAVITPLSSRWRLCSTWWPQVCRRARRAPVQALPLSWARSGSTTPRRQRPPFGFSEIRSNGCVTVAAAPSWLIGGLLATPLPMFPASPVRPSSWPLRSSAPCISRSASRSSLYGRPIVQQPKAPPNFRVYEFNGSAGATWSTPVPLVGQIEREAYPLDALPPAIRGAVEEVQDAVQAPAEMVASSALAVVSLAAQSLADVSRSKTLPGPSSLYFLTVAESGDRKSTVDRLMGRAIHDFQDAQRDASKDGNRFSCRRYGGLGGGARRHFRQDEQRCQGREVDRRPPCGSRPDREQEALTAPYSSLDLRGRDPGAAWTCSRYRMAKRRDLLQ